MTVHCERVVLGYNGYVANLLPATERARVRGERYTRLGVYALLGVLASILLGGVLTLPSFFVVKNRAHTLTVEREALTKLIELKHGGTANVAINETKERLAALEDALLAPSAHDLLVAISQDLPTGVVVWSYEFKVDTDGTVTALLSGRAATRDALLAFGDALRQSGRFGPVNIPVAALAKSEKIPFSLSLSVLPKPNE